MMMRLLAAASVMVVMAGGLWGPPGQPVVVDTDSSGSIEANRVLEEAMVQLIDLWRTANGMGLWAENGADPTVASPSGSGPTPEPTIGEAPSPSESTGPSGSSGDSDGFGSGDPGSLTNMRLATDAPAGSSQAVESAAVETESFSLVALTWPADAPLQPERVEYRSRQADGWSDWSAFPESDASGADTGQADGGKGRDGTEPVWLEAADGIQLRTSTDIPADADLVLVSPGSVADANPTPIAASAVPNSAATRPTMFMRSQWGANEALRGVNPGCATPDYASSLSAMVVHHTADGNGYSSVAEAMGILRSIQSYHVYGRQWCDIGYNFLVDKWGNVYEGRSGGVDRLVIGVHTGGFNTGTVGVSVIGNYESAIPGGVVVNAVGAVAAWKFGVAGLDSQAWFDYRTGGGENSKYPAGAVVHLPRIFGHRDTAYTSCPGTALHQRLDQIRQVAKERSTPTDAERRAQYPLIKAFYQDLLGRSPDQTGLDMWANFLANGRPVAVVANAITYSTEYVQKVITASYKRLLARDPDSAGMATWTSVVQSGLSSVDDLDRNIVASREYYLRSGNTNAGFVAAVYRAELGRAAGDSEVSFWADLVGRFGLRPVVNGILGSVEWARGRVDAMYRVFLGRACDAAGCATWTPIQLSAGSATVRVSILSSVEYRLRAQGRFPS